MKFVILATQRSGTTLLTSLFQEHPQMVVFPEVFLSDGSKYSFYTYWSRRLAEDPALLGPDRRGEILSDFIQELTSLGSVRQFTYGEVSSSVRTVGFNVKYDNFQCEGVYFKAQLERLIWANDTRVIHLVRRNYLRTLCSSLLNQKQQELGRLAFGTERPKPVSIELPTGAELFRVLSGRRDEVERFRKLLSSGNSLEIHYEDFFEEGVYESDSLAPEFSARLLGFLGVSNPSEPLRTKFVKINPHRLEDLILNFEDVKESLAGTEFEELLHF